MSMLQGGKALRKAAPALSDLMNTLLVDGSRTHTAHRARGTGLLLAEEAADGTSRPTTLTETVIVAPPDTVSNLADLGALAATTGDASYTLVDGVLTQRSCAASGTCVPQAVLMATVIPTGGTAEVGDDGISRVPEQMLLVKPSDAAVMHRAMANVQFGLDDGTPNVPTEVTQGTATTVDPGMPATVDPWRTGNGGRWHRDNGGRWHRDNGGRWHRDNGGRWHRDNGGRWHRDNGGRWHR